MGVLNLFTGQESNMNINEYVLSKFKRLTNKNQCLGIAAFDELMQDIDKILKTHVFSQQDLVLIYHCTIQFLHLNTDYRTANTVKALSLIEKKITSNWVDSF